MPISFRNAFYAGALLALVVGLWLARLWQPERQVRLHTEHLLAAANGRDWQEIEEFVAMDYRDQWGHDREEALRRLRLVLQYARGARLQSGLPSVEITGRQGLWLGTIKVEGEGEGAALLAERINPLEVPFQLDWQRFSRKPWDWRLVAVRNRALEIPSAGF